MKLVLVYADSIREGRKFYKGTPNERVGYRIASDFEKKEKCDAVKYAKDYKDIKKAYEKKVKD